ncbi:MAG TPA: 3-hydroxyacyl-CoA dehydrogenase family protein, partial [Chitinophagaceae bacterium]|nr:3-hydroxyacyl-CoA dehydrogenase family protein [Chitinophagaceae bacterium]
MTKRIIRKIAVLGSGIMGSRIACHFAGIGVQVLLLDIPAGEGEKDKNKIVNNALNAALRSNPSPVYTADVAKHIVTGNFDDNLKDIGSCDWVIEVVVERLDIKRSLYEKVENFRKPGALITSNTSGIPIHLLSEGRSDDFKRHFCGTHFFNPPRYLRLLEIIPTRETDAAVVDFLLDYGDLYLGKTTVLAKDTPAFIANRIGVFSIMSIFRLLDELELTIDEVEVLTGTIIGRPKSATFRTADVVGIDTLVKVARGVYENCPGDEAREIFQSPKWLDAIIQHKWLGDKTGQGFFSKRKNEKGETEIFTLNLKTMDYEPRQKVRFASFETARSIDDLKQRLKVLVTAQDKSGEFYRLFHYHLFSYISHRVPEISEELYRIDDAMKAGFGWEIGAFETWDALGVESTVSNMKESGFTMAAWVEEMLNNGNTSFYKTDNGERLAYTPA